MAPLDIDTALEWRGRTVVDRDGQKIGKLDELYLDESERPAWGAITTGLFGRRQSFVPLGAIEPDGDDLRVPFDTDRVKDAPNVEPDAQLSDEEEDRLYRHYGVEGGGGDAGERVREPEAEADRSRAPAHETRAPAGEAGDARRVERDGGEGPEVIRSEEEVSIGTRRRPTHRARLKKYVVTEHVKQVVPVQREEVRVEYDRAGGGEAVTEGEVPVRDEAAAEGDAPVRREAAAEGDAPVRREAAAEGDAPVRREGAVQADAPVRREAAAEGEAPVRGDSTGERAAAAGADARRPARTDAERGVDPEPGLSPGERDRQVVAGGGSEDLAADRAFESEDMAREDRDRERRGDR